MRSLKTMSERSIRSLKAMHRDQIQEHLRFAQELGVVGVSRDRAWRERKTGAADPRGRPPAAAAAEGPTHTSKSPIRLTLTPVDAERIARAVAPTAARFAAAKVDLSLETEPATFAAVQRREIGR